MDLYSAISGRRSIRQFSNEVPSDLIIERILTKLKHVPSPLNKQPVTVKIIKGDDRKKKLFHILEKEYLKLYDKLWESGDVKLSKILKSYWRFAVTMFNAPVILAIGSVEYNSIAGLFTPLKDKNDKSNSIYIGACLYNISLSAYSEGLGSCIYTAPISLINDLKPLQNLLRINVSAFITLGYPNETLEILNKKSYEQMVSYL